MSRTDAVGDGVYSRFMTGDNKYYRTNPGKDATLILQRMYRRILTEMCLNRFKWEGFPDSVDTRFVEMTLFHNSLAVAYKNEDLGKFLVMKGNIAGKINYLDNATHYNVFGNGFPGKMLSIDECVPIWANYMRVPDLDIVLIYSNKLAEIDRTIEINTKNARRSKILVADENTKLSVDNINRAIENGDAAIRVARPLGEVVSALDLGVHPDSIEKLDILASRQWNKCMTLLGIDNANQDKKERLVSDEVDANSEQVKMVRAISLNARQEAANQINKMFPELNVTVSFNTDVGAAVTMDTKDSDTD